MVVICLIANFLNFQFPIVAIYSIKGHLDYLFRIEEVREIKDDSSPGVEILVSTASCCKCVHAKVSGAFLSSNYMMHAKHEHFPL